ncbi:4Fe-4S dicluster domain-containing protein [Tepidibacter hydrothermalis]|uniref:4Fe-4S dicluster domain-containing protein n=1 Tax=Tepidibacter hydrothermalis TaxID=3036126 RepID=A0ABY8EHJ3_9FIRM|nr:4Fe-4S dicluster domain-containing protein [Tepidibacter hydrothermalis]WFD11059.1 4Fe-4S dicluster domain-containing protein [Tepidibacter hydrothermalis]
MRKFESQVQVIKHDILKEVATLAMEGNLEKEYKTIPKKIAPGPKAITRCCVYKEREIVKERVKLAMGGNKKNKNIIEVISSACDACPVNRFTVTESCRGCLAHKCSDVCPVGAIYHVEHRAYIDNNKCIECGKCKNACPYNAISDVMRPCRRSCGANALSIDENKKAVIDNDKCIQCGACIYKCPFGAIMDKSFIVDVINLLKKSKEENINVYAVVAPAIASQFKGVGIGKVFNSIKKLGFDYVVEAALGADIIALHEGKEFTHTIDENGLMTSSCCPAFVSYITKNYPNVVDKISNSVSPMIAMSRIIKNEDSNAKVIFIGPCTAKKMEIMQEDVKGSTDYVLTFEELEVMLDAVNIDVNESEENILEDASFYGRIFAKTGGLVEAVKQVIKEGELEVDFNPIVCDGIKECDKALKMANINKLNANFIEGMACSGGCIGGAGVLNRTAKDKIEVEKYGQISVKEGINDSIKNINISEVNLDREFKKSY